MPEANSDWTKKVDDLQHSLNQRIQETMDGKMPEANSDWTKKADDLQHSLNQRIQETVDGKMLEANSDIYIYIACIHPTYLLSLFEIAIWRPVRDFPKSRLLFAGCGSAADTTTAISCEVQRCRGEGRAGPCQAENWELLNGNQLGNNGDILVMGNPSTM